MDIQKEREAFEKWYAGKFKTSTQQHEGGAWAGWYEAKAQAVPEGYVAVPKEPLLKMIESASMLYPVKSIVEAQELANV